LKLIDWSIGFIIKTMSEQMFDISSPDRAARFVVEDAMSLELAINFEYDCFE